MEWVLLGWGGCVRPSASDIGFVFRPLSSSFGGGSSLSVCTLYYSLLLKRLVGVPWDSLFLSSSRFALFFFRCLEAGILFLLLLTCRMRVFSSEFLFLYSIC
jgi:hypothetical protein